MPKLLKFSLWYLLFFLLCSFLARLGFWWHFRDPALTTETATLLQAFVLGTRFDLRLGLVIVLPFLLLGGWAKLSPFRHRWAERFWWGYFVVASAGTLATIGLDFGHYSYLRTRLNAAILNFLGDWQTSAEMVWQSYPVIKITVVVFVVIAVLLWSVAAGFRRLRQPRHGWQWHHPTSRHQLWFGLTTAVLVVVGIHGKLSQYPLRWSDAFFTPNPFIANIGLNPVLNFFDTLDYKSAGFDQAKVEQAYPVIADWLGVSPNTSGPRFSLRREIPARSDALATPPNIVLVLVESFSAYKTSTFGNPLGTTPYFDQMAKQGILFTRFFTPHFGTARGVFTTLTGIPDVETANTSSRNPQAADQHILMDSAFPEYERFYFIGGSTSWANIRGVLTNNIRNIRIYEEGHYQSKRNDTWGISDTNLFKEANQVLKQQNKPFFAIIQTSGNHRPYTIPAEDRDFQSQKWSLEQLKANGFDSQEEYDSFRYMDYSIKTLIETAKKEAYFDNTVFVFLGDHGITGNASAVLPAAWTDLRLSSIHTPFLLYAPKLLRPAVRTEVASQVDVMATLAGLLPRPYINTTFGRDVLAPSQATRQAAFTITHDRGPEIGFVQAPYYFMLGLPTQKGYLAELDGQTANNLEAERDDEARRLRQFTQHYYEMARYLLLNNKKQAAQKQQ